MRIALTLVATVATIALFAVLMANALTQQVAMGL